MHYLGKTVYVRVVLNKLVLLNNVQCFGDSRGTEPKADQHISVAEAQSGQELQILSFPSIYFAVVSLSSGCTLATCNPCTILRVTYKIASLLVQCWEKSIKKNWANCRENQPGNK